jgi:hypothetical protein
MAKQANRGHGEKKNSKLHVKEASVTLDDVSRSMDYEVELSEEEKNCENLAWLVNM